MSLAMIGPYLMDHDTEDRPGQGTKLKQLPTAKAGPYQALLLSLSDESMQ